MSTAELPIAGRTVTRSAGVCGLREGDSVLLPVVGGTSTAVGGTETQRGWPSDFGNTDVGGTVDGGRGPKG